MPRPLPTLVVLSIILLSGVVDALWTNRWTAAEELDAGAGRLATLPMTLGEWDGRGLRLEPRVLALLDVSGYVRRQYVNRRTGSSLSLLILCGRPGPVSVHPPEVCYDGAGFQQVGQRTKYSEPATRPAADFWVYHFQNRDSALPVDLRVFCSWSTSGAWRAADTPRLELAGHPIAYKMYVVRELPKADEPLKEDPSHEFIQTLLPELQRSLFLPD